MTPLLMFLILIGFLPGITTSGHITDGWFTLDGECPTGCTCNKEVVDCSYVGLEAIPRVPSTTTVLILTGNQITRVTVAEMERLGHLEELYLNDNIIRDVTWPIVGKFLKLLDLSSNLLYCDCKLKTTLDLFSRENIKLVNLESTKCDFPRHLRGRSISDLTRGLNVCRKRRDERGDERDDEDRRDEQLCEGNPCQHGGTCIMGPHHSWRCECLPQYYGLHCEWHTGDILSVTVKDVTSYAIELTWNIEAENIKDFRIAYGDDWTDYHFPIEQIWLNKTTRFHRLTDLQPDTIYKICLAAFSYNPRKRSPGNIIEEVCLFQSTDTLRTTAESRPYRPPTEDSLPDPSLNSATDNRMSSTTVMTIFGVILSICLILIFAVAALYIFRQRGINFPRQQRRRSPPNIVQTQNPRSTRSPTPSVQDMPIREDDDDAVVSQDNDVPFILVTSDRSEDVNNEGFQDAVVDPSSDDACAASLQDEVSSTDAPPQLTLRKEAAEGDSTHEDDSEHLINDDKVLDTSEQEVTQC